MTWLINPLTPYAVMAVVLMLTLILFLSMKHELAATQRRFEKKLRALEEELAACRVLAAERSMPAPSLRIENQAAAHVERSEAGGLTPVKRQLVLVKSASGAGAQQIAEELQLPRNQVDLLLKVQRAQFQPAS